VDRRDDRIEIMTKTQTHDTKPTTPRRGRPRSPVALARVNLLISVPDLERVKEIARLEDRSICNVARRLIARGLETDVREVVHGLAIEMSNNDNRPGPAGRSRA
jgi:hypothetical protein